MVCSWAVVICSAPTLCSWEVSFQDSDKSVQETVGKDLACDGQQ